jgi:hypothetical protein
VTDKPPKLEYWDEIEPDREPPLLARILIRGGPLLAWFLIAATLAMVWLLTKWFR